MAIADLLAQDHLSIVSRSLDHEIVQIQDLIEHKLLVDGRSELEAVLGKLLACGTPPTPKTLDLIGHSTADKSLLVLGDFVIDAARSPVVAFFRELAEQLVLPRLGIHAVRLLGCLTADTEQGRWTICTLADLLGVEVFGTRDLIFSLHYNAGGFAAERRYVLVGSSELSNEGIEAASLSPGVPHVRVLDIDALPALPLEAGTTAWPVRVASPVEATALLRMIRRRDGATMPGLLTAPMCELALPSARPGRYHRAQVLLDGEFVRVYPDGVDHAGIVYPIDDPYAFRLVVDRLPAVPRDDRT